MIIFIKGPNDRKRVEVNLNDTLNRIVKDTFKIEDFSIWYDESNTLKINGNTIFANLELKQGSTIYLQYEIIKKDIKRQKDKLMCDHDLNAMCPNCASLDPWDQKYYKDNQIKYLSYGSYKEMCKHKQIELEMENYSDTKCKDHSSKIKCVNCIEKDILLKPQIYRMVDHIEFDDSKVVENFIKNWSDTRKQYFGILVGKYILYDRSPLGLKCLVSGIWIPNQENFQDGFVLTELLNDRFLENTNLEFVGMIYTYLGRKKEEIVSSLEIDFVSKMQFMFPYLENKKIFNSRFVTIVTTENEDKNIELYEYQVSSQCMALTRNQFIYPTSDSSLFYTKKNILYRTRDNQSDITKKVEDFLPVEYFIVRLTHGNKQNPLFLNSEFIPVKFSNMKMFQYLNQDYSFEKFSNFSFLMKIKERVPSFVKLFKWILQENREEFEEWKKEKDFKDLISPLKKFQVVEWECRYCTYINEHARDLCEVCGNKNTGYV